MTATDLIELAKVLEHAAAYARHVAADIDAGREPKAGELRRWLQEAGEALANRLGQDHT